MRLWNPMSMVDNRRVGYVVCGFVNHSAFVGRGTFHELRHVATVQPTGSTTRIRDGSTTRQRCRISNAANVSDESHLFDFEDGFNTDEEHAAWVTETRERAMRIFGIDLPTAPQHWSFVTVAELIRRRKAPVSQS